jgi:phospholipid/cholesterol/gamma-HCH transport system substrate-binding protein
VSLKGVSATTTLLEKEEGEPPTLKADPGAGQDVMQAAREVLNKAEAVITSNQEALHKAIDNLAVFTDALARNSDGIDEIVTNTKQATASARELADNLDKRTAEITVGINKMTATATRQIEIVGKSVVDLARNPQRILFGGSGSDSSNSSGSSSSANSPKPAAKPRPQVPPAAAR